MNLVNPYRFDSGGVEYNSFIYSTVQVNPSAANAIQVRRNSDSATQDIGFSGTALDTAAINTFTSSGDATVSLIYDQNGLLPAIGVDGTGLIEPEVTSSGSALDYVNINATAQGFSRNVTATPGFTQLPIDFSDDVLFHFVMRNERAFFSGQRASIMFSNADIGSGQEGCMSLQIINRSGNYRVSVIAQSGNSYRGMNPLYENWSPIGTAGTDYTLFTVSFIGGVILLYRDGTLLANDQFTAANTAQPFEVNDLGGICIGTGGRNFVSNGGRTFDFKGALCKTGDLSTFDVAANITEVMTLYGI